MEKQKQILAAALKLFVTYGFHGTPTSRIAEEAGVANGTLFHHYKTKEDLVVCLYNDIKNELANSLSAINHETDFIAPKFKNTFTHTLYWALNNREKFYYIQQFECSPHLAKISPETIQQQAMVTASLLADGIRKKLFQTRPQELMLALFNSHIQGVYQYLVYAKLKPEQQEIAVNQAYEMVWDLLRYK